MPIQNILLHFVTNVCAIVGGVFTAFTVSDEVTVVMAPVEVWVRTICTVN